MRLPRPTMLAATFAVAALSLLAAGCGGGASPGVANVSTTTAAHATAPPAAATQASALLAVGRCLRQHGLANLPDPTIATEGPAKGKPVLAKQALHNFPDSVVSRATAACQSVLQQAGIGGGSSGRTPQEVQYGLAFAQCVRRHGVPNFPDPNGQGTFDLAGTGINEHALTPAQLAAARACLAVAHGAVHLPAQNGAPNGQ